MANIKADIDAIEALRLLHVELWVWLADNDTTDKNDWPGWKKQTYSDNPDVLNARGIACFCCPAAKLLRSPEKHTQMCCNCPVRWGRGSNKYTPCLGLAGSMYRKWQEAKTQKDRRRLALKIAHAWLPAGLK